MSCHWCSRKLTGRQRRFCSTRCTRLYNDSACNPWHRWVFGGTTGGRWYKVQALPGLVNGAHR